MPPHLPPGNQDNTPHQRNARVLLQSLEELRDSLTDTVNQLTGAIGRLSNQAAERERVLLGRLRIEQDGTESSDATLNYMEPGAARPLTFTTPSAISNEVSSLSNPITTEQIHSLLDRAARSPSVTSSSATAATSSASSTATGSSTHVWSPHLIDPWLTQAQTIEQRIQRLSRTARELRERAAAHLGDTPLVPETSTAGVHRGSHLQTHISAAAMHESSGTERSARLDGVGSAEDGTFGPARVVGGLRPDNEMGPVPSGMELELTPPARDLNAPEGRGTTGMGSLLARMRTDQERLETGIRRLSGRTQSLNLGASGAVERQQTAVPARLSPLTVAGALAAGPHPPFLRPQPAVSNLPRRRAAQQLSEQESRPEAGLEHERIHPRNEPDHRPLQMPSRSKGMHPTNARRVASQPQPKVVATATPPSPASTVRPGRSESASRGASPPGPAADPSIPRPTFSTLNQPMPDVRDREGLEQDFFVRPLRRPNVDFNVNIPRGTFGMLFTGNDGIRYSTNVSVAGDEYDILTLPGWQGSRQLGTSQRQERGESGMTYRGMTVSSRIRDAATPAPARAASPDPLALGPQATATAGRFPRSDERIVEIQRRLISGRGIAEPEYTPLRTSRRAGAVTTSALGREGEEEDGDLTDRIRVRVPREESQRHAETPSAANGDPGPDGAASWRARDERRAAVLRHREEYMEGARREMGIRLEGISRLRQLQMDMRTVRAGPPPGPAPRNDNTLSRLQSIAVDRPETNTSDELPGIMDVNLGRRISARNPATELATIAPRISRVAQLSPSLEAGLEAERAGETTSGERRRRTEESSAAVAATGSGVEPRAGGRERAVEIMREPRTILAFGAHRTASGTPSRGDLASREVTSFPEVRFLTDDESPYEAILRAGRERRPAFMAGVSRVTSSELNEIDVEEPGGAPTQAVSLAGARDGERLDRTRRLAIDRGSEGSPDEDDIQQPVAFGSERSLANVSDDGADDYDSNAAGAGDISPRQASVGHILPGDTHAPKESFSSDLHLWPTAGPSTSIADSRVYIGMSDL